MVVFVYAADPDSQAVSFLGNIAEWSLVWVVVGMIVITGISSNKRRTSYPTWYFVTWLQYARWLGLINTPIDSELDSFLIKLKKGLNGTRFFSSENTEMPDRFSQLEIYNYHFIETAEKTLIIFFGSIAIIIILTILGCCYAGIKEFKESVWSNLLVRSIIICCYDFFLFGLLQISHFSLFSLYETICSVLAVVLLAVCIIWLLYLPIYYKTQRAVSEDNIQRSTLLEEFLYEKSSKSYYYLLFMLTRLISAAILVFSESFSICQWSVIGSCVLINMLYLLIFRPFIKTDINYYIFASEFCHFSMIASVSSYSLNPSNFGEIYIRWIFLASFWIGVLICIVMFLITLFRNNDQILPVSTNSGNVGNTEISGMKPELEQKSAEVTRKSPEPLKSYEIKHEKASHNHNSSELPLVVPDEFVHHSALPYYSKLASKYAQKALSQAN